MGQESGQTLLSPLFRVLQAAMKLSPGLCSPVELGALFLTRQVVDEIQFLAAGELRPSASEASPPHRQFPSWLPLPGQQEREAAVSSLFFQGRPDRSCLGQSHLEYSPFRVNWIGTLIASSTFFHLYHILLVRSKLQVLPHKDIDRLGKDFRDHLRSLPTQAPFYKSWYLHINFKEFSDFIILIWPLDSIWNCNS